MTLYNPAEPYHRPSRQMRPIHPEAGENLHPRCIEMAEAMREGADTFRGLVGRGFSAQEITAFHEAAQALARENSVRHLNMRPDAIEDIIDKARHAVPNRPPLPRGIEETQATLVAWSRYCAARSALTLDPWATQRERCLSILRAYLDRAEIFEPIKQRIIEAVAETLPQVAQ